MHKILLVEDSKLIGSIIKKRIETELQYTVQWVNSYKQATQLLEESQSDYLVCLAGIYLPDATSGEIIDYVLARNIPVIVFTGEVSDEIREQIWSKKVIDYVYRESQHTLDYIIKLIGRIEKNKNIKVLVVDDSKVYLTRITNLLSIHRYDVYQAQNGVEALNVLYENPEIQLVITDFNMPEMDGLQLLREIRKTYTKEELSVIGMSGDPLLSAKFIKMGANDFIGKNFFTEEFYCRITQNIEMLEYIKDVRDASNIDFLTNVYNRRYLFSVGENLFQNSIRDNLSITVAMMDIDFFKKINDVYGHEQGDNVLKNVSRIIKTRFRKTDVVARIGGEEFCVLAVNMDKNKAVSIFNDIREKIEVTEIFADDKIIRVTISIGICCQKMDSLEEMINHADQMLYKAKNGGRNQVVME